MRTSPPPRQRRDAAAFPPLVIPADTPAPPPPLPPPPPTRPPTPAGSSRASTGRSHARRRRCVTNRFRQTLLVQRPSTAAPAPYRRTRQFAQSRQLALPACSSQAGCMPRADGATAFFLFHY